MQRIVLLAIILLSCTVVNAQRKVRIKPADLKKVSYVKLKTAEKEFPKLILYKTTRKDLTVVRHTMEDATGRDVFMPHTVAIDEFDHITIYNKKRRIWGQIIGGVGLGATAYFVTDQIVGGNDVDQITIELLGQSPESNFIEPIVAGIIGAGVGVILGEMLSPIRINVKKDRKLAYEKLRKYSYR